MTVFRGYLTIIKRNLVYMFAWILIFMAITLMINHSLSKTQEGSFQAENLAITLVDQDDSTLSRALADYLSQSNTVTLSQGDPEELTQALYYESTSYVLTIPQGFAASFLEGNQKLQTTKVPGSTEGYYLDSQIESFLNQVRICQKAGFSQEEAIKKASALGETEACVTLTSSSGNSSGDMANYVYLLRYLPYLYISVLCYCISYILKAFTHPELHRRMMASAIPPASQSLQGILAFGLLLAGFWGISLLLPLVAGCGEFYSCSHFPLYLINSLLLLAVAGSMAFLVGNLIHEDHAINGITNVLSLGMAFLCGVFVPLDMLGTGIRKVAQFLPVYWYETINDLLGQHASLTGEMKQTLLQGFLIQAAAAAALLCITLAISKRKAQSQ